MSKIETFSVDRYSLMPPPEAMDSFMGNFYLIKAELKNVSSAQWRRVIIHSMQSFSDLHRELLQAFGLSNNHLAAFHDYSRAQTNLICEANQAYGIFNPALFLADVVEDKVGYKMHYTYNFEHPLMAVLTVEQVVKTRDDLSGRIAMSSRD